MFKTKITELFGIEYPILAGPLAYASRVADWSEESNIMNLFQCKAMMNYVTDTINHTAQVLSPFEPYFLAVTGRKPRRLTLMKPPVQRPV